MAMIHDSTDPEGVKDDGSYKPDAPKAISDDLVRARQRKGLATAEAFLRTQSWDMAAQIGGYPTARAARVAAEKALEAEFKESPRSQEYLRKVHAHHLGLLLRSVAGKAYDATNPEHLAAVKVSNELLTRQAKVLGLDAPTRLTLIDPTEEQIQEFLNANMGPPQIDDEMDIFDADVIEDEPNQLEA